jgi:hypothetical protein
MVSNRPRIVIANDHTLVAGPAQEEVRLRTA